ncbi:MAG: hypothetical protein GY749_09290 [Desulfobacteraceae bacterium]|nr:hypothetical protein [Desulfobacteraceae bacterium]
MLKISKQTLVIFTIVILVFIPFATAMAQLSNGHAYNEKKGGAASVIFDVVLLRPFGMLATVAGSALFVVSLPFAAVGGNTGTTYETMVEKPAKYTFTRPLGKF